jgi:hypothetical protein
LKKGSVNKKKKIKLKAITSIAFSMERSRKFQIVWLSRQEYSEAEVNIRTQGVSSKEWCLNL